MTVVIVVNAVALTKRWVPLWLGSAISFTSWWGATVLGVWKHVPYSFWVLFGGYIVSVGIVALVQHYIRKIYLGK